MFEKWRSSSFDVQQNGVQPITIEYGFKSTYGNILKLLQDWFGPLLQLHWMYNMNMGFGLHVFVFWTNKITAEFSLQSCFFVLFLKHDTFVGFECVAEIHLCH